MTEVTSQNRSVQYHPAYRGITAAANSAMPSGQAPSHQHAASPEAAVLSGMEVPISPAISTASRQIYSAAGQCLLPIDPRLVPRPTDPRLRPVSHSSGDYQGGPASSGQGTPASSTSTAVPTNLVSTSSTGLGGAHTSSSELEQRQQSISRSTSRSREGSQQTQQLHHNQQPGSRVGDSMHDHRSKDRGSSRSHDARSRSQSSSRSHGGRFRSRSPAGSRETPGSHWQARSSHEEQRHERHYSRGSSQSRSHR